MTTPLRVPVAYPPQEYSRPDKWLHSHFSSFSRTQIQRALELGEFEIETPQRQLQSLPKALSEIETLVHGGEAWILWHRKAPMELNLDPVNLPLEILYEDDHLVVLNKPAGLTVHPSETDTGPTLVHALLFHIKNLSGIGGVLRPGIVHRLDRNTSGAIVITKSDLAHQKLSETFARHEIERRYWALCYGEWRHPTPFRLETFFGRNPKDRKKYAVLPVSDHKGRKAASEFQLLGAFGRPRPHASWIEAKLETGRTHQVRVHLTHLSNSLLGDPIYGTPTKTQPKWLALSPTVRSLVSSLPGQALHARVLGFQHPIRNEWLRFEAEPPKEFQRLLTELQNENH
jgi:23S rRNA pseudouridine1911/1915/1917 synthase